MHISQKRIGLENSPMKQRLANDLTNSREAFKCKKPFENKLLVGAREANKPLGIFEDDDAKHHCRSKDKGYGKRCKKVHVGSN